MNCMNIVMETSLFLRYFMMVWYFPLLIMGASLGGLRRFGLGDDVSDPADLKLDLSRLLDSVGVASSKAAAETPRTGGKVDVSSLSSSAAES